LLQCTNGSWSVSQSCPNGCTVEPAGTPDQCTSGPSACSCYNGNGIYCATGAQSYASQNNCTIGAGTSSDLLQCANGSWSVSQSCPNGCIVEPAGTPDQCSSSGGGTCPGLSLSAFISNYTGNCTPGGQCVGLAATWQTNLGLPAPAIGNAINYAGASLTGFTWVPNAAGIVPSPGDLVVYGGSTCDGVTSQYGHIDIAVSAAANSCAWTTFDQNWCSPANTGTGACCPHTVNRNWCNGCDNVLGWQHLTACTL
ncbi:MAG: hypothetical protein ACYDCL_01170, partial [Myxococcales bacterium]